jgi:formate-dependent nitrite reductase membrane component NrfD
MLRKELVERAARKRTYVMRIVYAVAFFGMFLFTYRNLFAFSFYGDDAMQGLRALGRGDEIYRSVLVIQIFGILLFLPAMMCGLITDEKERGTLPLLLLT